MEVTTYNDEKRIDIRKYNPNGYRTKMGVSLNPSKFKLLAENIKETTETLEKIVKKESGILQERHLGGNIWLKVESPYTRVQLRRRTNKHLYYTRYGVSLDQQQWQKLVEYMELIEDNYADIKNVIPCIYTHGVPQSIFKCKECNPDSWNY